MGLFEELQDLMLKYRFRPDKQLSQFFCINEALLQYLVNSAKLKKGDVVLEIGPGTGFLTKRLIARAKEVGAKVVAFEVDPIMLDLLNAELKEDISSGLLNLVNGNVLEQDFEALKINKVVSLPPYHISSDLLTKIGLTNGLERVILVLDRGFTEKFLLLKV
jgi:16S rRNA A1518/A1519 N6-dimethyltransferase RsmA/KsgA/DIM1 with predicted DNA glycosylase/AP lyase activity